MSSILSEPHPWGARPTNAYVPVSPEEVERSIPERFELIVARHAERLAVRDRSGELTYAELNRWANRTARYLCHQRPSFAEPVALMFDHGLVAFPAMFGALKAAKPYAVLDPSFPLERLRYVTQKMGVGMIVHDAANAALAARLADTAGVTTGCLDEVDGRFGDDNLGLKIPASQPCYVNFTSGSTGRPKGVIATHRVRMQSQLDSIEIQHLSPDDRFTALHSIAFSAAMAEIYGALLTGASVYPLDVRREGFAGLKQWMQEQEITVFQWISSAFRRFAAELEPTDRFPHLRLIALGSEPVSARDVELYRDRFEDHTLLVNRYGTTETGNTNYYIIDRYTPVPGPTLPSGYSTRAKSVLILNAEGIPQPEGIVGEIAIKSNHMPIGYWGEPELTAERWLDLPEEGTRLCFTGDLGRISPDGCLENLGRRDNQVKVRGHRIELVEVEAALLKLTGVRDAAVIAAPDPLGETRLAAYVSLQAGQIRTAEELERELRGRLHSAMIPSAYTFLEALPLAPTGKILRSALPPPVWEAAAERAPFAAPKTELEHLLAAQFEAVLEQGPVGLDDNFFTLGGDSLRAAQLANRLQRRLDRPVTPPQIFEAPTVRRLAERILQLTGSPNEEVLLPIPRLPEGADAPLSSAQQRLWFLDRLEPGNTVFNEPLILSLKGELRPELLSAALDEIVQRHAVLRATFPLVGDEPVQRVAPAAPLPLPVVDLSQHPEAAREAARDQEIADTLAGHFDLETGPLLRARLLRLDPTHHVLVVAVHHIATDGTSFGNLVAELAELYRAGVERREPRLPELPVQFGDFAAWQRLWRSPGSGLEYWVSSLKTAPNLELPLDFPRPARPDHSGGRVRLRLPVEQSSRFSELAAAEGATPFMALLGVLALVLGRWSGAEELVIGAPVIDRPHPDAEPLVGIFLNNLSLRIDLRGDPSFRQLLGRIREVAAEAYAHAHVPFEQVVDALGVPRDTSRHPVFEVVLNHLVLQTADLELPGLRVQQVPNPVASAKVPLTLYTRLREGAITLNLVYQAALFSQPRMESLMEQLRYVIETVTEAPDQPLSAASLVTPAAVELLPDPSTPLCCAPAPNVITTFLQVAARTPEAVALQRGDHTWSYGVLAREVEAIARALTAAPSQVVAVTGSRCSELVAAVLGIMRAGRVLLTLDPALPLARQELMLREAGCRLLLHTGEVTPPDLPGVELRALDRLREQPETLAELPAATELQGPAYVFYTSGSTGTPKAVLGTHEGLSHFIRWQGATFGVGPADRCALLIGLSFDAVLRDLFLPLDHGATLCIPEAADLEHGNSLFRWLERSEVSLVHGVPSLVRHWLSGYSPLPEPAPSLATLRLLFLAGESLTGEFVAAWRSAFPRSGEIVNLYGPTETTLVKCYWRVPAEVTVGGLSVGRPMPDTQALVLRSGDRQCGLYEPGEIAIRTPFRTRGYLNAAAENAQRFVPNPFNPDDPDDRLYLTGDRGFVAADGCLTVLDRLDGQIKVRGVRIQPGEVEAALRQHPAVRAAAVDVRPSARGEQVLVAYLVPAREMPDSAVIRRFLAEQLPPALVPSCFVAVRELPLTSSGKLDRRALPDPQTSPDPGSERLSPRNSTERRLSAIWSEVLPGAPPGVHDDFFQAGGHSLLAVQLLVRVEREFGRSLPLVAVMQAPTIAEMAQLLGEEPEAGTASVLVPIQPAGCKPTVFGVHGIGGGVLFYRRLAELLGEDQPFYGLQAPALAGAEAEPLTVEAMAEQYVLAIRTIQPHGPYHLIGLSFGGNIALEMAQQLLAAGETVALLGMLDTKGPGYPRFPGRAARIAAHGKHFLDQPPAGRARYLRVRLKGTRDLLRRRILGKWYGETIRRGASLPRLLEDVGLGHLQAARAYRRREYPGRITLFRAEHQPVGCIPEWDNGWSRVAQGGVEVYPVPGEHAAIVEEPHVRVLAEALMRALAASGE